jgi:hypothetical protein
VKKLQVSMEWGGQDNRQWMMNHLRSGYFLMNFPDCKNVNRYFEAMDKMATNKYEILIRPLEEGCRGDRE